jgi:hypothetical protein
MTKNSWSKYDSIAFMLNPTTVCSGSTSKIQSLIMQCKFLLFMPLLVIFGKMLRMNLKRKYRKITLKALGQVRSSGWLPRG